MISILIQLFNHQDNQITYEVGIFNLILFNRDIWLRKLYHRAAQQPIRVILRRASRIQSQKTLPLPSA